MNSQLNYEVSGKGEPVVLLHGFLEDSLMWNDLNESLKNYQVIRIDLPGHGLFSANQESYTMKYMAGKVVNLLLELNVKNPSIIGHSMGGYVGLEIIEHIDFNRLILFNSNFWEDSDERKTNRNRLIDVIQKNKDLFLNEAIRNLFYIKSEKIDALISDLVDKAKAINTEEIIKTTRGLRDRQNHADLVSEYYSKIRIVQAENDPIIPLDEMEDAISQLKNKPELHIIKNSGHMSLWENFEATNFVLTNLLPNN